NEQAVLLSGIGSEPSSNHLAVEDKTLGRPCYQNRIQRRLVEAFGEDHAVYNDFDFTLAEAYEKRPSQTQRSFPGYPDGVDAVGLEHRCEIPCMVQVGGKYESFSISGKIQVVFYNQPISLLSIDDS